jgi:pyridoxamine 5'-phosphate oxidase
MDEIAEVEPLAVFERWLDEAWKGKPNAHAMTLATATPEGRPSARAVLLKGLDRRGFVLYTNLESRKREILSFLARPHIAAVTVPTFRDDLANMLATAEEVTITEQDRRLPRSHRRQISRAGRQRPCGPDRLRRPRSAGA